MQGSEQLSATYNRAEQVVHRDRFDEKLTIGKSKVYAAPDGATSLPPHGTRPVQESDGCEFPGGAQTPCALRGLSGLKILMSPPRIHLATNDMVGGEVESMIVPGSFVDP